ncbi:EcoKMrr [Chryseobacterium taklimakanense]|uniref:EcoKMrr n=1 Tax=Chryseobacterium taklimakanense TaxID=536441 RepID=A0A239WV97_9FLAO|nr:restriction endonuclease [Chryseobacterium taklimakanense]SNV38475.1 EcoKMrr [Chryseobacterium taklimakanense]
MADKKQAEFTKWFGPLLNALRELGGSARPKEVVEAIAKSENVPDIQREEIMKSGILRFDNQVAWARQYLVWEGLLDNVKKGVWTLSSKGQDTHLSLEDSRKLFLKWVEIHQKARKDKNSKKNIEKLQDEQGPEEVEHEIAPSLLEVLQTVSPIGFEHICKRLLREHGFENVFVTQASRDGGIDGYGTLELNPFVSMKVLFQCKRYQGTVSRSQVGDFRNAMIGRADKGIILTTGTFSEDAKREASREGAPPIELIDGKKLVELFEKVELGVKPKIVYEVDYNFFEKFIKK